MTPPRRSPQPFITELPEDAHRTLGTTADNFASRIQRRLKEQEIKETESKKAGEARHVLMLQAMTTIRKALVGTSKINLGDRFRFDLAVNDWEGWPRLELNLIDRLAPSCIEYGLIITANDRKGMGSILVNMKSGESVAKLQLEKHQELEKLPLILKKSVRHFLDVVAAYILNPRSPQELLDEQSKALNNSDFDVIDQRLQGEDLFKEDNPIGDANKVDAAEDYAPLEYFSPALK